MPPPKLVITATKTYEELEGGQGREVFFRPHRYRSQDLTPLNARALVHGDGAPLECAIRDVSQNGAGLDWPKGHPIGVGDRLDRIEVLFDEHRAYSGEARVGSVRELEGGYVVVGVSFRGGVLA